MMKGCKALSPKEIKQICANFSNDRDKTLFLLGCYTGFRISELLSLQWNNVVSNGKVVDVLYVPRRNRKGKREGHQVPLNNVIKKQLEKWHKVCVGPVLFPSREGARPISYRQANRIIKDAALAAGVTGPVATHSMRKTFGDRVYNKSGQDLHTTQVLLGHKNISSTVHYLSENKKKAARVVNSIKI